MLYTLSSVSSRNKKSKIYTYNTEFLKKEKEEQTSYCILYFVPLISRLCQLLLLLSGDQMLENRHFLTVSWEKDMPLKVMWQEPLETH